MNYKPRLGTVIRVTNLKTKASYEEEVSGINGQFIFVGENKFHVLDDRVGKGVWRYRGVEYVDVQKAKREQVKELVAAPDSFKKEKLERIKSAIETTETTS